MKSFENMYFIPSKDLKVIVKCLENRLTVLENHKEDHPEYNLDDDINSIIKLISVFED